MKVIRYTIISFLTFFCIYSGDTFSQKNQNPKNNDTRQYRNTKGTRYAFWFLPTRAHKIHGIAFGIVNACENQSFQSELTINGLSLEIIGAMPNIIEQLIFPERNPVCHSNYCRTNGIALGFSVGTGLINGIAFAPTAGHLYNLNGIFLVPFQDVSQTANGITAGLMTRNGKTQGIQAAIFNKCNILKGLQIGLWNRSRDYAQGVQIGLINSSEDLKGIQIGLINHARNKKIRTLPFLNFSFK